MCTIRKIKAHTRIIATTCKFNSVIHDINKIIKILEPKKFNRSKEITNKKSKNAESLPLAFSLKSLSWSAN